jgi:hypothetical protein
LKGAIVKDNKILYDYAFFDIDKMPENTMLCCKEKINDFKTYDNVVILK